MKILVKFPTRSRTQKFFTVLNKYYEYANDISNLSFLITCDEDDHMMNNDQVKEHFTSYPNLQIKYGVSVDKIHAVNKDMELAPEYDILLLASDDMVPQVKGYDDIIRNHMKQNFPDTDGVLWYNDGFQKNKLNTLSILGKKYYQRFDYIYNPDYKSYFADNEFMEVSKLLNRVKYFDQIIIRHEHPDWGLTEVDELYKQNASNFVWPHDNKLFHNRKEHNFDLDKKRVISFCLWGEDPKYTIGAIKNAQLAQKIYPRWECWFYVADNVPQNIINQLQSISNTKIINMGKGNWTSMFWRFLPSSDPNVSVMLSRDTDSRLSLREKFAVDEWLVSKEKFHIMRDHPYHGTEILGGMWGVKNPLLHDMKSLIDNYTKGDFWQVDQNFLKEKIYPKIKSTSLSHDSYFTKYGSVLPFPTDRKPGEFIGKAYNSDDSDFNPEHSKLVK